MRNLHELNLAGDYSKSVQKTFLRSDQIESFEREFSITLPQSYKNFMRFSNGGRPELDCVFINDKASGWAVNHFYFLDKKSNDSYSLRGAYSRWNKILGKKVPFAEDGGGNQFYMDTSSGEVGVCVHDEAYRLIILADSFETFIDSLNIDPDMI